MGDCQERKLIDVIEVICKSKFLLGVEFTFTNKPMEINLTNNFHKLNSIKKDYKNKVQPLGCTLSQSNLIHILFEHFSCKDFIDRQ